ncbi:Probable diguanylate cyclase AdrA [Serratia marcescens]|nr:Probable diguanylate cyclase AdrA [Serratia marcescens]
MYIAPPIFDARKSGLSFAKRTYLPRVAGLGLGFICVCAALYPLAPPTAVWLLLAFHGFLWPHLAYRLACRAKDPFKAEIRNLLIDSAFGGFWAAMMAFNALPAIVILSMMSMNNIASAGKTLFVKGLVIQLATAMLTAALLGFPFHPHSTALQIYLCLPMIYLYPTLLGLVTYRTAKRLAEKKQELQRISTRDGLTGLYNRRHWEHLLHRQFDSCRRYQDNATLILMDIDRFKTINDTFGHPLGDEALAALAEELLIGMRNVDIHQPLLNIEIERNIGVLMMKRRDQGRQKMQRRHAGYVKPQKTRGVLALLYRLRHRRVDLGHRGRQARQHQSSGFSRRHAASGAIQ